jgi:hypothetical protein
LHYLFREVELLKIYCRHPFNTSSKVIVTQGCKPGHEGSKDLNFVNPDGTPMPYGTPVYAMESGHVAEIRSGRPHCPTSYCPGFANNVVIQGSDGFYTEYAHITPLSIGMVFPVHIHRSPYPFIKIRRPLRIGGEVRKGDLLGWVDKSGYTEGNPSIHIARYTPGDSQTLHDRPICDWYILGVDSPIIPNIHGVGVPFIPPECTRETYYIWD